MNYAHEILKDTLRNEKHWLKEAKGLNDYALVQRGEARICHLEDAIKLIEKHSDRVK